MRVCSASQNPFGRRVLTNGLGMLFVGVGCAGLIPMGRGNALGSQPFVIRLNEVLLIGCAAFAVTGLTCILWGSVLAIRAGEILWHRLALPVLKGSTLRHRRIARVNLKLGGGNLALASIGGAGVWIVDSYVNTGSSFERVVHWIGYMIFAGLGLTGFLLCIAALIRLFLIKARTFRI